MLTDFVTTGSYISQYSNFSRDSGNVSKERILKKKKKWWRELLLNVPSLAFPV